MKNPINAMKLVIRHSLIESAKAFKPGIRKQILTLEPLRRIDEAIVHLAHERDTSPPYHVHVHLVTPGPDFSAEARDHTLAAALGKVVRQLAHTIKARANNRRARLKDNPHPLARLA